MRPVVSVIIPAFRRPAGVRRAVESVLAQHWRDLEVIVADDADDPLTAQVVSQFEDPRVRYVSRPVNLGVGTNVATAIADDCSCDFISILCDDDWWHPDLLAALIPPLLRDSEVAVSFADHWVVDRHGAIDGPSSQMFTDECGRFGLKGGPLPGSSDVYLVERQTIPAYASAVFRRSALSQLELLELAGPHYDLAMSFLALQAGIAHYVPERLAYYRVHEAMLTKTAGLTSLEGQVRMRQLFHTYPAYRRSRVLRGRYSLACTRLGHQLVAEGMRAQAMRYFLRALWLRPQKPALYGVSRALLRAKTAGSQTLASE